MPTSWAITGTSPANTGAAAVPPKRLIVAGGRFVDRHEHRDLRVLGREEADEARVVHPVAVRVVVAAVRAAP